MQILQDLAHILLDFFYTFEYPALFILVLLEEAGIPLPVPGDTLVMLAAARRHEGIWYSATVITLASIAVFAGSSILFELVRRGGRPFVARYGKYIRLNQRRLDGLERWFTRYGSIALIVGRIIPGLRIPITVVAGLSGITYRQYAPRAGVAAVIWSVFFYWLGGFINREIQLVAGVAAGLFDTLSGWTILVLVLIGLLGVGGGTWQVRRVRRRQRAAARQSIQPARES